MDCLFKIKAIQYMGVQDSEYFQREKAVTYK